MNIIRLLQSKIILGHMNSIRWNSSINRNRNRNALPIILPPPIYNQKKSSNMGQNTWDKLYFNMWRKHESQISIYIKFLVLQNQIFYKIVIKLKNFDEFFF